MAEQIRPGEKVVGVAHMNNNSPSLVGPSEFRKTLGKFASGITIITVRVDGNTRGMTASSFCSVSLDPPLVAVSVNRRAAMHGLLQQSRVFGVSILARDQQALSDHFAGRSQAGIGPCFVDVGGIPLIGGALAHICCTVDGQLDTGDHTMYIGRVDYLNFREDDEPLIFYGGKYRSLANPNQE